MPSDTDLAELLRLAAGTAHTVLARALIGYGVTAAEWGLLRELHAAGAVPQARLAASLGMTAGAVSRLVDRLVAKRLLVRGRGGGGDRRVHIIGLTGTGAQLIPELARAAGAAEAALFADLAPPERAVLATALRAIGLGASRGVAPGDRGRIPPA